MTFLRRSRHLILSLLLLVGGMLIPVSSTANSAADDDQYSLNHEAKGEHYKHISFGRSDYNFWSHFTLSTNLFDWALVMPNLGLEIDLGNPIRKYTPSLYLQYKHSPSSRDYLAEGLFDQYSYELWNAHAELRFHFSFHRHAELYKSRFYAGLFAEYTDFKLRTPLDLYDRDCLKVGDGMIFGLSAGYEFPGFSYDNRHFFEFQLGGNIGLINTEYDAWNAEGRSFQDRTFPMLTELRFGLAWRNYSISRKYWQPNLERYARHSVENQVIRNRIEAIIEDMEQNPIILHRAPKIGADSVIAGSISLVDVRAAIRSQYDDPCLRAGEFYELVGNTSYPITRPSEHYSIGYKVPMKAEGYDLDDYDSYFVLPFKVRIQGYEEALEQELSFNRALREYYYDHDKQLPSIMVQAESRDQFINSATMFEILGMYNSIWQGGEITRSQIRGLYFRENGEFVPVTEEQLNRRGTYAIALRFHPQIEENYDTLACRFNLEPYIDPDQRSLHNLFTSVSNGNNFFVNHPWANGHEGKVSKEMVIDAISQGGCPGLIDKDIEMPDSLVYGRNLLKANFGNILGEVPFIVVVEDSASLRFGNQVFEAVQKGIIPRRTTWNADIRGNSTYGPLCQGVYNDVGDLVPADNREVLNGVMRYLTRINPKLAGKQIQPVQVEDYTYSGIHWFSQGHAGERWTVLRFVYRFTQPDGLSRTAFAHVAYRLKVPKKSKK